MIKRVLSQIVVWFLKLISYLPLGVLYIFAQIIYILVYQITGYRKKIVRNNIQNSFPEKSAEQCLEIEKQFYQHFSKLVVEIIKLPAMQASDLLYRVHFKNPLIFEKHLENGQSFMACSGHLGNWEWATAAFAARISLEGFKQFNVYKKLNNPSFENYMKVTRNAFGGEAVEMKQILRNMVAAKNEKFCVVLAADQSPASNDLNYFTSFLHQHTPIYLGVEKLAKSFDLPIIFFNTQRTKNGYYEVVCEEICTSSKTENTFEITEKHVHFLEKIIKKNPYNWLWSHKRWKYSNAHQTTNS